MKILHQKKPCGDDENMGMIESGKCKSMDDISDCNSADMELSQTPYGIGNNFPLFYEPC